MRRPTCKQSLIQNILYALFKHFHGKLTYIANTREWASYCCHDIAIPNRHDFCRDVVASPIFSSSYMKDPTGNWPERIWPRRGKPSLPSENRQHDSVPPDDLFLCLRPVLAVGLCLGCFPFGGVLRLNKEKLPTFRPRSCILFTFTLLAIIIRNIIATFLMIKVILGDNSLSHLSPVEKMNAIYGITLLDISACIRFLHIMWNGKQFCQLFQTWRGVSAKMSLSCMKRASLRRRALLILVVLLASIFLENLLNNLRVVAHRRVHSGRDVSVLEACYYADSPLPANLIGYVPGVAWLFFLTHKVTLYANNIMAVVEIVTTMAVLEKFRTLAESLERETSAEKWLIARTEYMALQDLVEVVNKSLSIHIVVHTFYIFYFVVFLVYTIIQPQRKLPVDGVYGIWGLLHLLTWFLLLCIPAGRLHSMWKRFWVLIQKCPEKEYSAEVQRFERVVAVPVAITGMDLFTLRSPFILSFFNVVLTMCIVLLQASASA